MSKSPVSHLVVYDPGSVLCLAQGEIPTNNNPQWEFESCSYVFSPFFTWGALFVDNPVLDCRSLHKRLEKCWLAAIMSCIAWLSKESCSVGVPVTLEVLPLILRKGMLEILPVNAAKLTIEILQLRVSFVTLGR